MSLIEGILSPSYGTRGANGRAGNEYDPDVSYSSNTAAWNSTGVALDDALDAFYEAHRVAQLRSTMRHLLATRAPRARRLPSSVSPADLGARQKRLLPRRQAK